MRFDTIERGLMILIAHRGLWQSESEKNTLTSISRALTKSVGTEIDVRDYKGHLVISHDIATKDSLKFNTLMEKTLTIQSKPLIAVDVKASGLLSFIEQPLKRYGNYFCMGMTFTEQLEYINAGLRVFTRESEYEKNPLLYEESIGVWMDYFYNDELCMHNIELHTKNNKNVCIVSAELNGREHTSQWEMIRMLPPNIKDNIILCTDYYFEANTFFGE